MKNTVTVQELEEMRAEVLRKLAFAKDVQAKTKDLEKQVVILSLALNSLHREVQ